MKFTTFFSLFLLCAFSWNLSSARADFLVDSKGKFLQNHGVYGLRPVITTGNGGGVEYAATGNETCPLSVVQNPDPFSIGFPVRISTIYKIPYLTEKFPLTFEFYSPPGCAPTPSRWTPVKGEEGELSVKITRYDNTGSFHIKTVPNDIGGYNIVFCPYDNSSCAYVGVQFDAARNRRLVLTYLASTALWVRFERLVPASSATDLHEPSLLLKSQS